MKPINTYINTFLLLLFLQSTPLFGQRLFHQDIFYGGVTAGGFSTGQGSGFGTLPLFIEPGSTIRKAYLFSYRQGFPPNAPITVNGTPFFLDTTDIIMRVAHANPFSSPIHLYYEDITNYLTANFTSTFNITIPAFNILSNNQIGWGWFTAFLYIEYENPTLPKVVSTIWINDKDYVGNESYTMTGMNPINSSNPVGLSLMIDRACNNATDGTIVTFNNNNLGIIGTPDLINNIWNCSGTKGHFYYQNNALFSLDDDTANATMNNSDGLADVSTYLSNGAISYNLNLLYMNPLNPPAGYNTNLLFINAYTTPCDTFSTSVPTASQDTICFGESVQLQATGGSTYSWFGLLSAFNDSTLANPIATPIQTTTYTVAIKNDSGCVITKQLKIWVTQPIDSIITTPTTCGNATGSITAVFNTNSNYNFTLYDSNFIVLTNNTTGIFNQLAEGKYLLESNIQSCTFYDTVIIGNINITVANFNTTPLISFINPTKPLGKAPFEVDFVNTSQNANNFQWTITEQPNNDTLIQHSTFNTQNLFTQGGVFEVCLIAYNNLPKCADTVCKTIFIDKIEEITLFIPNVFTPNGDNENEVFSIQIFNADLLESLEVKIFNRWGKLVESKKLKVEILIDTNTIFEIWDGNISNKKASEGTYFYVLSYTTKSGETTTEKGTVSLLR